MSEFSSIQSVSQSDSGAVCPAIQLLITLLILDRSIHRLLHPSIASILFCKQLEWDPKKIKQEKKEQEMKARQAAAASAASSEQVILISLLSLSISLLIPSSFPSLSLSLL